MLKFGQLIKRSKNLDLQKREIQYKLETADEAIKTQYKELLHEKPHGFLIANPQVKTDFNKILMVPYTSKPGAAIKQGSISFLDENKKKRFITLREIPKEDLPKIKGEDFCSLKVKPYFTSDRQKAVSNRLLELYNNNEIVPIGYLDEFGQVKYKYLPAQEVFDLEFIQKIYADERDSFDLAVSEIDEAKSKLNDSISKDAAIEVKSEDIAVPGDEDGSF